MATSQSVLLSNGREMKSVQQVKGRFVQNPHRNTFCYVNEPMAPEHLDKLNELYCTPKECKVH